MMTTGKGRAAQLAVQLVATLPVGKEGLFNPWMDWCDADDRSNPKAGPSGRLERLAAHLDCEARFILVGEAPGYQGARYSGVAFTSERLLLDGSIPRMNRLDGRLTLESPRGGSFTEPSATIIWKTLYRLGIEDETILWNAVQLHPHTPGQRWTNRTPKPSEVALGEPALRLLLQAYPSAALVAIGRKAEGLIRGMGVNTLGHVPHPAYGGATDFAEGLEALVRR